MKFFLDTADVSAIKTINELGVVDGVTTNPTIISREGRDFETVIKEICQIVDGPVSNIKDTTLTIIVSHEN